MRSLNKKGDAPMILLAVVTLGLILMLGFVFLSFRADLTNKSLQYSKLSNSLEFNQKYVISSVKAIVKEMVKSEDPGIMDNFGKEAIIELSDKYNYNIKGQGNLFGEIRNENFAFDDNKFEIKGLFVTSEIGANSAKRVFDLCLEFDINGDFVKNC